MYGNMTSFKAGVWGICDKGGQNMYGPNIKKLECQSISCKGRSPC